MAECVALAYKGIRIWIYYSIHCMYIWLASDLGQNFQQQKLQQQYTAHLLIEGFYRNGNSEFKFS